MLSIDFATAAGTGVGVGVTSVSSSKEDSGPNGLSCFLVGVVADGPRKLALNLEVLFTGLARYCGPVPIVLFARPIDGLVFGVASFAGVCRTGDCGRGKEGRRAVGLKAGLAARDPGPIDWLKLGLVAKGVLPPWLKLESELGCGVVGVVLLIAFSNGRNMPEPGLLVLK